MQKLKDIKENLKLLHEGKSLSKLDVVEKLPKVLRDDESILDAITGKYKKNVGALMLLTDQRLILMSTTMIMKNLIMEDFELSKVSSIEMKEGFISNTITVYASGNKAEFINYDAKYNIEFCEHVKKVLSKGKETPVQPVIQTPPPSTSNDLLEQLERLGALKEKGLLTDDEFQKAKEKILKI